MELSNLCRTTVFAPGRWGEVHASTLVRLPDGAFLAAWFGGTKEGHPDVAIWGARGNAKGWSDPVDGGVTWSPLRKTSLPNNNSGIDLARDSDGRLLLSLNPVGGNWTARTPLSLMASEDNGATWEPMLKLETDPGEFSYPAVVATPNGFAGTYTSRRETITFWAADAHE